MAEPFDCPLDLDGALPFPENPLAGVAPDVEIEALAAHRRSWTFRRSMIMARYGCARFMRCTFLVVERGDEAAYGPVFAITPYKNGTSGCVVLWVRRTNTVPSISPLRAGEALSAGSRYCKPPALLFLR
jgi:hypothetical protein